MASEDELFLGQMSLLSEEDLILINGNVITSDSITHDTEACTNEMMKIRELERKDLYEKLAAEEARKFNWSKAFINTLLGALTGIISQLGANAVSEAAISSAIIAASATNPIIAAALVGAGVGYLTYLVTLYLL